MSDCGLRSDQDVGPWFSYIDYLNHKPTRNRYATEGELCGKVINHMKSVKST